MSAHRSIRMLAALTLALTPAVAGALVLVAPSAPADPVCGDTCVIPPTEVATPAGVVTVTTTADSAVTVHLTGNGHRSIVVGVPFEIPPGPPCHAPAIPTQTAGAGANATPTQLPPGPPCIPGYARTAIPTPFAGTVFVDTIVPDALGARVFPGLVLISIHPPSPCRVRTMGPTVIFTPTGP